MVNAQATVQTLSLALKRLARETSRITRCLKTLEKSSERKRATEAQKARSFYKKRQAKRALVSSTEKPPAQPIAKAATTSTKTTKTQQKLMKNQKYSKTQKPKTIKPPPPSGIPNMQGRSRRQRHRARHSRRRNPVKKLASRAAEVPFKWSTAVPWTVPNDQELYRKPETHPRGVPINQQDIPLPQPTQKLLAARLDYQNRIIQKYYTERTDIEFTPRQQKLKIDVLHPERLTHQVDLLEEDVLVKRSSKPKTKSRSHRTPLYSGEDIRVHVNSRENVGGKTYYRVAPDEDFPNYDSYYSSDGREYTRSIKNGSIRMKRVRTTD